MDTLIKQTETIIAAFNAGQTCTELAAEYGFTYRVMHGFLKRNGATFQRRKLNQEQEDALISDYRAGANSYELAKKYEISETVVRDYLHRVGLAIPTKTVKQINEHVFDDLNENALWLLGWFYSDGNVAKNSNRFTISVHRNDEAVLLSMHKLLGFERESIYRDKNRQMSTLYGCNAVIHGRLIELGCVSNKSLTIRYPTFLTEDWRHWAFLRGLWEGDGSIGFKSKGNRPGFNCELASGSRPFLDDIASLLLDKLAISTKIVERPGSNSRKLVIMGGREPILRLLGLMYKDGVAESCLPRKMAIYREMLNVAMRPANNAAINANKLSEGYFLSSDKVVYHVRGLKPFAREIGIKAAVLYGLVKPVKRVFNLGPGRWTRPTREEIDAATASGALVHRSY